MSDPFKPILDALIKEGFHKLPDEDPKTGKPLDYKITPYSLNTKLSFKFDNLDHFIAFLKRSGADTSEDSIAVLQTSMMELDVNPSDFFYVNFFEKGKTLEM
jgi:hypothetical protein